MSIKNRLDYLEQENKKTKVNLSILKSKQESKKIKDISSSIKKVIDFQKENNTLVEKKDKILNNNNIQVKKKPVIWL